MPRVAPTSAAAAAQVRVVSIPGPPSNGGVTETETALSAFDQAYSAAVMVEVLYFKGASSLDEGALETALERLLGDAPLLSGRLKLDKPCLATARLAMCNGSALLTVAEEPGLSLADVGPDSWRFPQRFSVNKPPVPSYIDGASGPMGQRRLLKGQEPLLKVRLTRLADGCVLAVTLAHVVADGVRWPALMEALAQRYREAAGAGQGGDAGGSTATRSLAETDRGFLSSANLRTALLECRDWQPQLPRLRTSLVDYWRAARLMARDTRQRVEMVLVHVPNTRLAQLKAMAAVGAGANPHVTTGDAIQALGALLMHAAVGHPLVPAAPKMCTVLVQMPAPPGYFGNAVYLLPVSASKGAELPDTADYSGALRSLAALIRTATADWRSRPESVVQAAAELEQLTQLQLPKMMSWVAGRWLPHITATTNYVPFPRDGKLLDFGGGVSPSFIRTTTLPLAREMVVIRPAAPPYSPGLFVQLCLPPKQAARLRAHPLLLGLVPDAQFVGEGRSVQ